MRQTARAGKCRDVFLRRLRVTFVAQRQRAIEEKLARLRGDLDQLFNREFLQRRPCLTDFREILAHDAGIDLADLGANLAGFVIFDLRLVE